VTRARSPGRRPSVTTKLADNGARLPTAPEPSSSYRPVSSSARVCRMTVSAFAPATITAAKRPDRHALSPPMVGEDTGPSSANESWTVHDLSGEHLIATQPVWDKDSRTAQRLRESRRGAAARSEIRQQEAGRRRRIKRMSAPVPLNSPTVIARFPLSGVRSGAGIDPLAIGRVRS